MHLEFEETHGNRMVYSPKFSHPNHRVRLAEEIALPGAGTRDGFVSGPSCEMSALNRGCGGAGNVAGERTRIFGTKEAQTIGMTRGFLLLTSKFSGCARRACLGVLFLSMAWGVSTPSARAQSASGWDKRGQAAELREDYDAAYEDYLKASQKSPKDMRYQARVDRMRFQAAVQHVNRGRVLRENGDIAGALNQFTRAKQIDPSNEAATQEIAITEQQDRSSTAQPLSTVPSAETAAMQREVGGVAAPAELKAISDEPITLHTVEDVKNIYTAIGQLAGLNVLFDPALFGGQPKRIPVDLKSVSLADALRIVGVESQTFYKTVTADTIYVAENTFTKHADLDEEAVQTFYLTNSVGQAEANDVATVLRNVLGTQPGTAIVPMISQNAIVVRESPDRLLLAAKLINDLDRPRAEVVVDVAILEVNRDKIRNLGITLPQSVSLTPQQTPTLTNTTTTTTTGTATTTASNFTLNTLGNFNSTNLAVTIGGGTVNALLTDADTRVLQNPSVRATDGQQATLKIGSKIPVAQGSFGAAAGIGGASLGGLGVQTQFSYQDVGVTIDMTPSIHLDREVSLKLDVENSTVTGQSTLQGGVTEPIIGTRSDKTTIQLHDGEPCLLAGILTKQDNSSNSGTPGLSSIPLLKYFFGSVYKENQQDEVVFILVPHIVRESTITGLNTRAIDTGTAQDIEIRRSDATAADLAAVNSSSVPTANITAANAASAMVQQMKQQALPPVAGGNAVSAIVTAPEPAMPAPTPGIPVLVSVLPANSAHAVGSTFQTSIVLSNAHDVFSVPMQIQFDPKVLELVNVDAGGLLAGGGQPVALVHRDEGNGLVTISASRPPGASGVDGQGEVCTLTFKAVGAGDTSISLVKVGAKNSQQGNLPASSSQGVVHVK
jgi:general secretion pathway protein D